jgi:AmiR/NasT family two-component response regulator
MTKPACSLRILFADDDAEVRDYFQELLTRLGHQVTLAENGRQLVELSKTTAPELIITDVLMPDLDGLQAAGAINHDHEVPVILVSAHDDADFLSRQSTDEIMGFLVKPVKEADVRMAIAVAMRRFEQFRALRREARDLRQALEDRKLLERAKGIVMRRLRVDEPEAFRKIKKLASDTNQKLIEVTQTILEAEEVFKRLERS